MLLAGWVCRCPHPKLCTVTKRIIFFFTVLLFTAGLYVSCKNDPAPVAAQAAEPGDPQLATINALLAKDPDNDSLLYRRAALYYDQQGYDEALADVSRALQLDSLQPQYYHLLADVMLDYGRPNDSRRAIVVLQRASEKFPERLSTWLKLSEFQLIVKQHADALASLNQVLQRNPQSADAFFMTGRVALDMSDTARAIKALQRSVQYDAANPEAWMFLGRIFSNRNDPQAIQYFDNALRVDSTNLEAREFKGAFYKRRGDNTQAFAIYRDIIARNPDYSNAYFDMGLIYLSLDSLSKAYDNFNIAVKTDPLFVNAYYFRGVASEAMGNATAALGDYKQANKMSPGFMEAKEARARLEKTQQQ